MGGRRLLENVICHAGIWAGNAVEDVIERDFCTVKITVLAGFDEPLGFAQRRGVDQYDVLLFRRGRKIEWSARTSRGRGAPERGCAHCEGKFTVSGDGNAVVITPPFWALGQRTPGQRFVTEQSPGEGVGDAVPSTFVEYPERLSAS